MDKNITIADIAEALGVSKTTVSRAISGKGRVGAATKSRVLEYIKEHDYKPNVIAQGLAKSRTYNIGVVMPENYCLKDMSFLGHSLAGLHEAADKAGYDILLTICSQSDLTHLKRIALNRKVDGVILLCVRLNGQQELLLQEKGIPFVSVENTQREKGKEDSREFGMTVCRTLIGQIEAEM